MSSVKRLASQATNTLSNNTIVAWTWYFRDTCFRWIDDILTASRLRIGGAGKVVKVDEALVGKRKYHRGRLVPGQWILGMVELQTGPAGDRRRGGPVRLEIIPNNCRNAAALIPLIQKHVAPGTTIMSDQWAAYNSLPAHQFNHLTINHSLYFVDPRTWANTQTIESQWRAFKRHHSEGGGNPHKTLGMHLCEFMWRREMDLRGKDPFLGFLEIAATVYPRGPARIGQLQPTPQGSGAFRRTVLRQQQRLNSPGIPQNNFLQAPAAQPTAIPPTTLQPQAARAQPTVSPLNPTATSRPQSPARSSPTHPATSSPQSPARGSPTPSPLHPTTSSPQSPARTSPPHPTPSSPQSQARGSAPHPAPSSPQSPARGSPTHTTTSSCHSPNHCNPDHPTTT
ncbi:hypothetical protein ISCGN_018734 [Ixodes scapularis]